MLFKSTIKKKIINNSLKNYENKKEINKNPQEISQKSQGKTREQN